MSDEEKTEAESTDGQVTPTEGETPKEESERRFTQAELDKIVKREAAKAVRKAKRNTQAAQEATTGKQDTAAAPVAEPDRELLARVERMEQREVWNRIALEKSLKPAQADTLFELYVVQKPDDPSTWVEEKLDAMGVKRDEPAPQPPNGNSGAPAHAQVPPVVPQVPFDPGAASGAPREEAEDPRKWNSADIARLRSITEKNGRSAFMNRVEKWVDSLEGGQPLFRKGIPKG
ncbi:MAG: hypothetical protein ACYS7Y_36155 [Planctomycetota bacterium]|jgi:hypothetical protein